MTMRFPADIRIGIVGGGIAGVAAGVHLRRAGYARVRVIERTTDVGGKCCTRRDGATDCELGAALLAPGYREVRALVRATGLREVPLESWGECGLRELAGNRPVELGLGCKLRCAGQLARFFALRARHPSLGRPGLAGVEPELAEPFAAWLARHGLAGLQPVFAPFLTGYGYGYAEEIPAAYALKYFAPSWAVPSVLGRRLTVVEEGYQALVRRLAATLDVRCGTSVAAIEPGSPVRVRMSDGREEAFDHVIVACAPRRLAALFPGDSGLAGLFRDVTHTRYVTLAAEVTGLPGSVVFVPEHFTRAAGEGRLVFAYTRRRGGLTVLNAIAGDNEPVEAVRAKVAGDVRRLGGEVRRVVEARDWEYFPRVTPAQVAAGFFDVLERRQGRDGLFFAGELLTFPAVETVCEYSRHLVTRHFCQEKQSA